ncbi:MAG TPA: DUF3570 domain-containing protein, partial [Draconibacterium sp.]|nr:DUF3570 domain-containing protein [Draconibacterium sp.]
LKKSGNSNISFNLGSDIISSASTDNIDYIMSSASKLDARTYLNANYGRTLPKHNFTINGGLGFSIESDYLSIGSKLGISKENKEKLSSYSAEFELFNDDLRWGRLNPDYYRPVKLIYPSELRNKEWFDEYKRYSYNLKLGFTQALNKKNVIGIFSTFSYQNGLLSTPFHRVYFNNGSLAVENLPGKRWKGSLGLQLNSFVGGRLILKNNINPYVDDWGIVAVSFKNETAIKLKSDLILLPNIRFYKQNATSYFDEYGKHEKNTEFYTSDYDLSKFESVSVGLGIKFSPYKYVSKRMMMNFLTFQYNLMHRSDGLTAHIFSLAIASDFYKKQNKLGTR